MGWRTETSFPQRATQTAAAGVLLSPHIYKGFQFFENVLVGEKGANWSGYGPVFKDYFSRSSGASDPGAELAFVPYGGSEGYSAIAYLPQAAAAIVAGFLG